MKHFLMRRNNDAAIETMAEEAGEIILLCFRQIYLFVMPLF